MYIQYLYVYYEICMYVKMCFTSSFYFRFVSAFPYRKEN